MSLSRAYLMLAAAKHKQYPYTCGYEPMALNIQGHPFSFDNLMPPSLIFDISEVDLNSVVANQEQIRQTNPQRGDMEHLNGIIWYNTDRDECVGFKDIGEKEFWVEGHIPGRPLFPGVLMIESAAQLCSFYVKGVLHKPGFIGFGGVESCKFRRQVSPGVRLIILAKLMNFRHGRFTSSIQGLVNGDLVFESKIIGATF